MTRDYIYWQEQDASVLDLSPFDALQASTALVAQRPPNEPWLALVKPTSRDVLFFSIALSLDAYHLFSKKIVGGFPDVAESLLRRCSQEEVSAMTSQEQDKGNSGDLWSADEGLLRLFVPSRLLESAKLEIEELFRGIEQIVIEAPHE